MSPIHPPRMKVQKTPTSRQFAEMLDNWVGKKEPHKYGLHYPDYSCCYPELDAPLNTKHEFIKGIKEGNVAKVETISFLLIEKASKVFKEKGYGNSKDA